MDNKLKGARPLLTLTANNEFASLQVSDCIKAFDLLYACLCGEMTQATMCVMMAAERLRQCNPDTYQAYVDHITRAFLRGADLSTN